MKKMIKGVTVTGADDSINPMKMIKITEQFPFVEWGILLSKTSEGSNRFPSLSWMEELKEIVKTNPLNLSGHLCGRWVRDLCKGEWSFIEDRPGLIDIFDRIQLNFHSYTHKTEQPAFTQALSKYKVQYIFQLDDVNNNLLDEAQKSGIDAVPLFDLSGGAGILPKEWPRSNTYSGYAGGLSPENVSTQIMNIASICGSEIWIDAETHLRSLDDLLFDLHKVHKFLEISQPWMIE